MFQTILLDTSRHVHTLYFWRIQLGVRATSGRKMHRTSTVFAGDGNLHPFSKQAWVSEEHISLQSLEGVETVQLRPILGEYLRWQLKL